MLNRIDEKMMMPANRCSSCFLCSMIFFSILLHQRKFDAVASTAIVSIATVNLFRRFLSDKQMLFTLVGWSRSTVCYRYSACMLRLSRLIGIVDS